MSNSGWQQLTLPLSFLEEYFTELGRDSGDLMFNEEIIISDLSVDIEEDTLHIVAYVKGTVIH